nr:uncharacterized protein LOC131792368 [Pocillopora verrucosa]
MFMVTDVFDCTFECLRLPSCVSVNVASNKEAPGNTFCELLSSDKYQKSQKFTGNKTSHHLFKKSQCISTPCQNGGTCLANYQDETFTCHCKDDFIGKHCENGATSCKQLFEAYNFNSTRVATLRFGLTSVSVYCHMGGFGCGDGVWTTVMKIDGSKSTFHYDSVYWGNTDAYNPPGGATAFDTLETKMPTYWNTPFTKICLGMKTARHINFVIINKEANSLYSLVADGSYRSTLLGRDTWKSLIGSQGSLQSYCNKEGFNAVCGNACRARIGVVSNNENACTTCDSRIGFGGGGRPENSNTCGNANNDIRAMCYILVQ